MLIWNSVALFIFVVLQCLKNIFSYNNYGSEYENHNKNNARGRQYDWGHMALWLIHSETYYARALGERDGPEAGLAHMKNVFHFIFFNNLKDAIFWKHAYYGRGMLFAKAGELEWALRDLTKAASLKPHWLYYIEDRDKLEQRIADKAGDRRP